MGRVHHVKKARKDNPARGIKKGQEYWWAGYRLGRSSFKRYWAKPPRPSQVTASDFLANAWGIQEEMQDAQPADQAELETLRDDWAERIREIADECQEKFDNMPDGLQQGDTGQLLESRVESMESWADEVEGVDVDWEAAEPDEDATEEDLGENTDPGDPVDDDGRTFGDFAQEALEQMAQACNAE